MAFPMRRIGQIPLTLRIPLISAGLMILVGVIASQLVLSSLGRVQDSRIREFTRLHIEALSVALGPHVLRKNIWEVYDTLDRTARQTANQRIVFTEVADEAGRVLAATDPERAPVDNEIAIYEGGARELSLLSAAGHSNRILLKAHLLYQGRRVGRIVTELDVADIVEERRHAGRILLFGKALATGVIAIFGYFVTRRLLKPIAQLSRRMRETPQVPEPIPDSDLPNGDTEMVRLLRTYNDMARAVEAKAEAERRLADRERFVNLGRLSASLAHEINNPLGGLMNAADTIRTYADRPKVVSESADILLRGLRHLRDVIRVTLEQNRLDRSGAALSSEDLEDLQLLIAPEARHHQQELVWQVETQSETLTKFAAAPVRQIVMNLLLNASEAAGPGGMIALSIRNSEASLSIEISDSGGGLTGPARKRLLSDDPLPPGGGIGLRLVRELVKSHAGTVRISVENMVNTIRVELPVPVETGNAKC